MEFQSLSKQNQKSNKVGEGTTCAPSVSPIIRVHNSDGPNSDKLDKITGLISSLVVHRALNIPN